MNKIKTIAKKILLQFDPHTRGPDRSYWIMRRVFASGLGLLYLNVFLIFFNQGLGLYGGNGILPIAEFVPKVLSHFGSLGTSLWELPSIFYFLQSDQAILSVGILGILLSLPPIFGFVNFPILFCLWILHMSIIHSGQIFYSYGWETQLLELTFLSFFLFPLWNPKLNHPKSPPKLISVYFIRWMTFRLMLGAGLIKLRGDACWLDLTCMDYHYQTQPNPHPLSWLWHQFPWWFHRIEVLFNHFVEIIVPFGLLGPRILRRSAGLIMALFQIFLIFSGNLSWLNWITLVMTIACFDDGFLSRFFGFKKYLSIPNLPLPKVSRVTLTSFAIFGVALSILPAINLVSPQQKMNASFNQFHLINSYGAFGSITKDRFEIIIRGTQSSNPESPLAEWKDYEFKCKPGDPSRRPCLITPYHLRLDWQIWFSAMRPQLSEQWLLQFARRLLENQEEVLGLLDTNPFPNQAPRYIKMDLYYYKFSEFGDSDWWKREFVRPYSSAISLQ